MIMENLSEIATALVQSNEVIMEETIGLMVANAEAESHADSLFEKLREKIVVNAIIKEQFIELHVRIKYAICRGQKYTDIIGVNTVSFDTVLELYNAGKAKPTKN
jgi:hypothetical protein